MSPPDLWDLRAALFVHAEEAGGTPPDLLDRARARARQRHRRRTAALASGAVLATALVTSAIVIPLSGSTNPVPPAATTSCHLRPGGLDWPCLDAPAQPLVASHLDPVGTGNDGRLIGQLPGRAPEAPSIAVYETWRLGDSADAWIVVTSTPGTQSYTSTEKLRYRPAHALVVTSRGHYYVVVPPGVTSVSVNGHGYPIAAGRGMAALPDDIPKRGTIETFGADRASAGYDVSSYD